MSILFSCQICLSQETEKATTSFGLYGNSSLNLHTSNFQGLPLVPNCCDNYRTGIGIGYMFGGLAIFMLSDKLYLETRLSYIGFDGDLSKTTYEPITNVSDRAEISHIIETQLGVAAIEPMVKYELFTNTHIIAGFGIGYMLRKNFKQYEKLIEPSDRGTFENKKRIRDEVSGEIQQTNNNIYFLNFGIDKDFFLNSEGSYLISPHFIATIGLTSVLKPSPWTLNSFRFGLSFKYRHVFEADSPLLPKH